jgi:uncharacterized protein (DUF1501 family)
MVSRRIFVKEGGLAVLGLSMVPGFVLRTAMAASPRLGGKKLIVIFQRGGVDGLNVVVPFGEKDYYTYRPTIAVPAPSKEAVSALDLDGFFGLHPSLRPLLPFYQEGNMAIVHASGSPHETRSHFEAQDYMESAAPGAKRVQDGWLNRYLAATPDPAASTFRGVALSPVLPRTLAGPAPTLALGSLTSETADAARSMYEALYDEESNSLLSGTSNEMFDAMKQLKEANPAQYEPAAGVQYANNQPFARSLRQVAQIIKADLGLEVAFVDVGGWDTHSNQGSVQAGRLPVGLTQYGAAIAAFYRDLGDRMEDVVILTMSEFGRTARENGNAGTDHGKANVMFLLGGSVKGGKVYADWPGLAREQLNENRDLAMTTDFRDVFAEVLVRHLEVKNPSVVFPDYSIDAGRFKGLL